MIFTLEGDLTDQASCPRSSGSDPQTVISDTVVLSASTVKVRVATHLSQHSPTSRHNPFNEDSDTNTTNTSADITPVHVASRHNSATIEDDPENASSELEVIRYGSYSIGVWLVGSHCAVYVNPIIMNLTSQLNTLPPPSNPKDGQTKETC